MIRDVPEIIFNTDRLSICDISSFKTDELIEEEIIKILTPEVLLSLPPNWQDIKTKLDAKIWLQQRQAEGKVYQVQQIKTQESVGFAFLYWDELNTESEIRDVRLGYLLAKMHWGKGLGTELIQGFIQWCKKSEYIHTLTAGVSANNISSIRVLEKCGFKELSHIGAPSNVSFYRYYI